MSDELTIIVPVYNEEESLPAFFLEMDKFISIAPLKLIILFVDDGSTDTSLSLIKSKSKENPSYCFISFDTNRGLSTAIKAGIDHSRTSLTGYIDADLQTSPLEFQKYLEFFPQYDMVNGIRQKRQDKLSKRISSKLANKYRRFMINDGIQDTCCPLKILKTSYARRLPFFTGMHRFIPALVKLEGGTVKEVPISHFPRKAGTSKYHFFNRLIGPFFDTLAFRWMRSRHIRYRIADKT